MPNTKPDNRPNRPGRCHRCHRWRELLDFRGQCLDPRRLQHHCGKLDVPCNAEHAGFKRGAGGVGAAPPGAAPDDGRYFRFLRRNVHYVPAARRMAATEPTSCSLEYSALNFGLNGLFLPVKSAALCLGVVPGV